VDQIPRRGNFQIAGDRARIPLRPALTQYQYFFFLLIFGVVGLRLLREGWRLSPGSRASSLPLQLDTALAHRASS